MIRLDPARTAVVAIDMHRGHLDPSVATLPLAAERCGPLVKRAAALLAGARLRGVPIVHVATEYRDAAEIPANPSWEAIDDAPPSVRRGSAGRARAVAAAPRWRARPCLASPGRWWAPRSAGQWPPTKSSRRSGPDLDPEETSACVDSSRCSPSRSGP